MSWIWWTWECNLARKYIWKTWSSIGMLEFVIFESFYVVLCFISIPFLWGSGLHRPHKCTCKASGLAWQTQPFEKLFRFNSSVSIESTATAFKMARNVMQAHVKEKKTALLHPTVPGKQSYCQHLCNGQEYATKAGKQGHVKACLGKAL